MKEEFIKHFDTWKGKPITLDVEREIIGKVMDVKLEGENIILDGAIFIPNMVGRNNC